MSSNRRIAPSTRVLRERRKRESAWISAGSRAKGKQAVEMWQQVRCRAVPNTPSVFPGLYAVLMVCCCAWAGQRQAGIAGGGRAGPNATRWIHCVDCNRAAESPVLRELVGCQPQ